MPAHLYPLRGIVLGYKIHAYLRIFSGYLYLMSGHAEEKKEEKE
jgi:hypothetical protein